MPGKRQFYDPVPISRSFETFFFGLTACSEMTSYYVTHATETRTYALKLVRTKFLDK